MSKKVNIIFSCYARYILTHVRKFANLKGQNIILATHDSDEGLDLTYKRFSAQWTEQEKSYDWTCNDYSEWDSRYNKLFTEIMWELMTAAGCNKLLADWFFKFRQDWVMVYHNKHGKTKLKGNSKQFSGNPFTICENTLMNMALTMTILDIDQPILSLWKGDDSAIKCVSSKYSDKMQRVLSHCGHKTKLHQFKSGEFAGWVCTENGLYPDVVRYAAKFLGKDYRDQKHFYEALQSLRCRLSTVKTNREARLGALALTEFYPTLSADKVDILFQFLHNSLNAKFSDLTTVTKQELLP